MESYTPCNINTRSNRFKGFNDIMSFSSILKHAYKLTQIHISRLQAFCGHFDVLYTHAQNLQNRTRYLVSQFRPILNLYPTNYVSSYPYIIYVYRIMYMNARNSHFLRNSIYCRCNTVL